MSYNSYDINQIIENDNIKCKGIYNIENKNDYVFIKNDSFIIFQFKRFHDVKICDIKYIHFRKKSDLYNILAYAFNFWVSNNIQFFYYKEIDRENGIKNLFSVFNFRVMNTFEYINNKNYKFYISVK